MRQHDLKLEIVEVSSQGLSIRVPTSIDNSPCV